jgi:4'-phosphopantetheinyl transferase
MPPEELLDDGVRARLAELRREKDRRRHATGAALADVLARAHGGPNARVLRRRGEAPEVDGGRSLYVSISHGGAWVAVAVTGLAPVGVDVERRDRDLGVEALFDQVLAPSEQAVVAVATDRRAALLTCWTRKEAVVKATGDGLRVDPRAVVVSGPDEPPALRAYPGRPELVGACTMVDLAPDGDHVAAVAVLAPAPVTFTTLER